MEEYKRYVEEIKETLDELPWEAIRDTVSLLHYARLLAFNNADYHSCLPQFGAQNSLFYRK